jgi:hypothetical protein
MSDLGRKVRNWALKIGAGASIILGLTAPHWDRDVYIAKVTEKERVVNGESSKYLIFTELKDGRVRVFENTDSFIEFKFNSSDLYGKLKEGKTYELRTYGWRIPFLSKYENIIGAEEDKTSNNSK